MSDRLSLVVCTLQRPQAVERLLGALRTQHRPPEEVVVVDASPDDRTEQVVTAAAADWPGELRHLPVDEEERGLTRQRNVGLRATTGELVAFLDDDTVPDPGYFEQLASTFARHPDAVGVGGCIDEGGWQVRRRRLRPGRFQDGGWERSEGWRWLLRRLLGLAPGAPGELPPSGHGRPVAFLAPGTGDRRVEFLMGGASAWRRATFVRHRFDPGFEGYGLYEDLDLCITAAAEGPLLVATDARLEHHHAPEARPDAGRYGRMVVTNGWYVWRRRWPSPSRTDRLRWWATTFLLAACRATGGVVGRQEAGGRLVAMARTLPCEWSPGLVRRRYAGHDHVEDVAEGVRGTREGRHG